MKSLESPSSWVARWARKLAPGQSVLDLAAGSGRHARWLAARGLLVTAVDRDVEALRGLSGVEVCQADLEGAAWPPPCLAGGRRFDAIVVTRYLFRPCLSRLPELLAPAGLMIYETFMRGQESFGRPRNPDFLLEPNELLEAYAGSGEVLGFFQGFEEGAMLQKLCLRVTR